MPPVPRRSLIKAALLTGSAIVVPSVKSEADTDSVTTADIAASEKLSGYSTTDAERTQMARSLPEMRQQLADVRLSGATLGREPATHFEPRLPGTPVPKGKSGVSLSREPLPAYDGIPESLAFTSATDLGRLLKARKVTSVALTQMYLARLKRFGPRLLCVVEVVEEPALVEAARADAEIAAGKYRGPLHGIPYGVKDLLAAQGTRTTYGAAPFKDQRLEFDSTVVARLREAGAILVAKLSMGELAMGDVWFGGKTRNPWRPNRGSSGSSAGSASAVAAGLVGFAIGTETLGSITSPSEICGVTGLRPTYGRVSRHGAMALSWTMDKIGPLCRGVEDCALVFAALHGPDGWDATLAEDIPFRWSPTARLSGLRVGIDQPSWEAIKAAGASKGARAPLLPLYEKTLAVLHDLGIEPRPIQLPAMTPAYGALADIIIGVEGAASFAPLIATGGLRELAQQNDGSWPNTFRVAQTVPASDYLQALRIRTHLQRAMAEALRDVDVYITFAGFGGGVGPSRLYTNLTGHPTVITRCGMTPTGMPVGIEFTGALYREDAALRLAFAYEQATEWHRHWPDTEKLPEVPPPL